MRTASCFFSVLNSGMGQTKYQLKMAEDLGNAVLYIFAKKDA